MGTTRISSRARKVLVLLCAALLVLASTSTASGLTFKRNGAGQISVPSGTDACPTFGRPPAFSGWFNIADMQQRGYWDGRNPAVWDYSKKLSQVICGASRGAHIEIGMYLMRALGTVKGNMQGIRPETDPELVYRSLQYVHDTRGVSVGIVLEGADLRMPADAKAQLKQRIKSFASLRYCFNGCLNTNRSSVFPSAVSHEKFLTISDTTWAGNDGPRTHPAIVSLSGNLSRSQLRWYHQETTLIYDDRALFNQFAARYDDMYYCAKTRCASSKGFSRTTKLVKQRGIWVDPIYRHYTDAGRGTTVSFSPQPKSVPDYYIQQFDDVDCAVDKNIRIAMFKLTDSKAQRMANALSRLRKRGCSAKMLLTAEGGTTVISPSVVRILKRSRVDFSCVFVATHTKMILIGPSRSDEGRALVGTANMSTSGLRYNEDHVLTFDTRRTSPGYNQSMRRLYSDYLNGWYEMSQHTRSCS